MRSFRATPTRRSRSCGNTSRASSKPSARFCRREIVRVFYATDLHGSEVCWRKFLNAAKFYDADVLICGGDMTGKANPTPWHTYREAPEEELTRRMEPMLRDIREMSRAIFNFHPPPFGTSLDEAPALDENLKPLHGGRALRHVGSKAVREAIDKYQPMLSLHGHIHEGKGITRIGKTLAINPGSAYEEGMLLSSVIELDQKKGIKNYQLVNG